MGIFFTLFSLGIFVGAYHYTHVYLRKVAMMRIPVQARSEQSLNAFRENVVPVLAIYCSNCHGHTGAMSEEPLFAIGNFKASRDLLLDDSLVSFVEPETSTILGPVRKGHQGVPIEIAKEMEVALGRWVNGSYMVTPEWRKKDKEPQILAENIPQLPPDEMAGPPLPARDLQSRLYLEKMKPKPLPYREEYFKAESPSAIITRPKHVKKEIPKELKKEVRKDIQQKKRVHSNSPKKNKKRRRL